MKMLWWARRTSIDEFGAEDHVGVLEHALLQRHDNELRMFEVVFDHGANVLGVAQIKRRIHLWSRRSSATRSYHQWRLMWDAPRPECTSVRVCIEAATARATGPAMT